MCSSASNRPSVIDKNTARLITSKLLDKNKSRQKFVLNCNDSSKHYDKNDPISLKSSTKMLLVRNAQMDRTFIRPRTIHVIRPGPRPRTIKKFLLNRKTAYSLEQVLDDINEVLKLDGPIYKMYNLTGEKIEKLQDLFNEDNKIFLCYSNRSLNDVFDKTHIVLDAFEYGAIHNLGISMGSKVNTPRDVPISKPKVRKIKKPQPSKPKESLPTPKLATPKPATPKPSKDVESPKVSLQKPPKTSPPSALKPTSSSQRKGRSKQPKQVKLPRASSADKAKKPPKPKDTKRSKSVKPKSETAKLSDNLPPCIYKKYELVDFIGIGNFAEVQLAKKIEEESENQVALKIIDKTKRLSDEHDILNEAIMLESISDFNHPNIIHLHEFYDLEDRIFLILDYVTGGDLFDVIAKGPNFNEMECVHLLLDLLRATRFLHSKNICHRDIKPENCLLYYLPTNDQNATQMNSSCNILSSTLKLTDFGLATYITENEPLRMVCGSPTYVAPEIIYQDQEGYNTPVDLWAIGVIAYILLCEKPPFIMTDGTQDSLFDSILSGEYTWPDNETRINPISNLAVHFVSCLLRVEPKLRMSSSEALKHPWIIKHKKVLDLMVNNPSPKTHKNKEISDNLDHLLKKKLEQEDQQNAEQDDIRSNDSFNSSIPPAKAETEIANILNSLNDNINDHEIQDESIEIESSNIQVPVEAHLHSDQQVVNSEKNLQNLINQGYADESETEAEIETYNERMQTVSTKHGDLLITLQDEETESTSELIEESSTHEEETRGEEVLTNQQQATPIIQVESREETKSETPILIDFQEERLSRTEPSEIKNESHASLAIFSNTTTEDHENQNLPDPEENEYENPENLILNQSNLTTQTNILPNTQSNFSKSSIELPITHSSVTQGAESLNLDHSTVHNNFDQDQQKLEMSENAITPDLPVSVMNENEFVRDAETSSVSSTTTKESCVEVVECGGGNCFRRWEFNFVFETANA